MRDTSFNLPSLTLAKALGGRRQVGRLSFAFFHHGASRPPMTPLCERGRHGGVCHRARIRSARRARRGEARAVAVAELGGGAERSMALRRIALHCMA